MERIIVAFEGDRTLYKMCEIFESSGIRIAAACSTGAEVLRCMEKTEVGLVFCGYKLRDMISEELFEDLPTGTTMLMLAQQGQLDCVENSRIVKIAAPVRSSELLTQTEALLRLREEKAVDTKRQRSEADKAKIAEAKELLMAQCSMTEEQAHRFVQKYSMDTGSKMTETASRILEDPHSVVPPEMFR